MRIDAPRWHELDGDECAAEVVSLCRALWAEDGEGRRAKWLAAYSVYEDRWLHDETLRGGAPLGARYNVTASVVDTGVAEIAARQRPKPTFLTSGGDWRTKRKAKKLDKFVEAHLHLPQGRYQDVWELGEDVFRDAEVTGTGLAKVTIDEQAERTRYDRVPAYEVMVDASEAASGDPRNWFHCYEMDVDRARAAFAPSDRAKGDARLRGVLDGAESEALHKTERRIGRRASRTVTIFEAWLLPLGPEEPGVHVYACTGGLLWREEWTWPVPPFAFLLWRSRPFGVWGSGLVEQMHTQHERVQELADRLHRRYDLCSQKRTYFVPGLVDEKQLEKSDGEVLIPVTDLASVPREVQTPPVTPAEAAAVEDEIRRFYDLSGVSQMSAQARKEPGVTSGIALQTLGDQKSVRFLPKSRAHELFFLQIGKLDVMATTALAATKPGVLARFPGKRFVSEIKWSDVAMDEDQYVVRVAATSALSKDPAQRLEVIEQLAGMGMLPREKFLELLGLPDLEGALEMAGAEAQWVEMLLDRYLDAEDADELEELGGYTPPDPYMRNPTAALVAVADAYFAALVEECPDFTASTLRRFMADLRKTLLPKQPPAPPAAPPGMLAPAPAAVGSPPPGPAQGAGAPIQ